MFFISQPRRDFADFPRKLLPVGL